MRLNFESLEDKHSGESCIILGPSRSLIKLPKNFKKQKIIAVGDSMIRARNIVNPDYWVASNDEFPVPYESCHLKIINFFKKTTFVYADSALHARLWHYDYKYLKENIHINWTTFDERHFRGAKCVPKNKCCDLINLEHRNKRTIQEILANKYNSKNTASVGGTVAEYAFALALYLNFKEITFVGLDIPILKKDYTYYPDKMADLIAKKVTKRSKIKYDEHYKNNKRNIINSIKSQFKQLFHHLNKKSIFAKDLNLIMKNFEIYSSYAILSGKKCYYTNLNSNLKMISHFKYQKLFHK